MKPLLIVALLLLAASDSLSQTIEDCQIFPADNPWNTDISGYPVHEMSQTWIDRINENPNPPRKRLHPDFGSPRAYGIPFVVVDNSTPRVEIMYTDYGDESDPGPMPIPPGALVEGGDDATGDRHVLVVNKDECKLYELFSAHRNSDNSWRASSGAVFDLTMNDHHPDGWTSADAAGLPIFPGLVKYDEIQSGEITHAFRFTVPKTQRAYIHPARHYASSITDPSYPPMGLRLRLKADYDITGFQPENQVLLRALKKYGMILADNGSPWFISGATDPRWDDDVLNELKQVPGSAFEAVYTGEIKYGPSQDVDGKSNVGLQVIAVDNTWKISGFEPSGVAVVYDLLGNIIDKIDLAGHEMITLPFSSHLRFLKIGNMRFKLAH